MPAVFVGIDVSKDALDVHHLPAALAFRVPNTLAGHRKLPDALLPLAARPADIRAVLESTGRL